MKHNQSPPVYPALDVYFPPLPLLEQSPLLALNPGSSTKQKVEPEPYSLKRPSHRGVMVAVFKRLA